MSNFYFAIRITLEISEWMLSLQLCKFSTVGKIFLIVSTKIFMSKGRTSFQTLSAEKNPIEKAKILSHLLRFDQEIAKDFQTSKRACQLLWKSDVFRGLKFKTG